MNIQVNMSIPKEWKKELERLARIASVEADETLTYIDLIRKTIKEKFNLKDENGDWLYL